MQIIDGKKIRDKILAKIKKEIAFLPFKPIFCDVLVGNDRVSMQYVRMKKQNAEKIGILFHNANFPTSIKTQDLIKEIKILNKIPNMCGIIIQLPLPEFLDRQAILDSIDPKLDVDCLGKIASEKFYNNYDDKNDLGYPTALSCMAILDSLHLDLPGKKVFVLGQGTLVGRPVTHLLRLRGLPVETIDNRTENISELLKKYDNLRSKDAESEKKTEEFLRDLFVSLGWDWLSNEVTPQKMIRSDHRTTKVDYSFKPIGELRPAFYLEAKRFSESLENPEHVLQAINYGKNSGTRWVILTNFARWRIFNSDYFDEMEHAELRELNLIDCLTKQEDLNFLLMFAKEKDLIVKLWKLNTKEKIFPIF